MTILRGVLTALIAVALVACVPDLDDPADEETPDAATADEEAEEPQRQAVLAAIGAAEESLLAASVSLEEAAAADDASTATEVARQAVSLLTASTQLRAMAAAPEQADVTPFLPSSEPDDGEDLLNRVVAAARGAGDHGSRLAAVLHDPVVGDLTTWQQDPDLAVDAIQAAADDGSEEAIAEVLGEVPRALALTLLATEATDLEATREYAGRASAHLAVAIAALEGVREDVATR